MLTDDYRVRIDAFEGPLDLLLYLIKKAEVEIADIPISTITDQYMAHLRQIERIDIDLAGEFLVMAATLMEIKARSLAPRRAGESAEQDGAEALAPESAESLDPRSELIRQLIAYKRSRDAAETLDRLRQEWSRRWGSRAASFDAPEPSGEPEQMDIEDLGLYDLVQAFEKIVATVNFERLGDHRVGASEDVPIEEHAEDIVFQLAERARASERGEGQGALRLGDVFRGRTRVEMIGLFLALLELAKSRRVEFRHAGADAADIELTLLGDAESSSPGGPGGAASPQGDASDA